MATTASTVVVDGSRWFSIASGHLWMDARADAEARFTGTVDHPVLRYSGGSDAVEWSVPKAMWLAKHEPETYRRAARIVEAVDFINFRLTGEWVGSKLNATCKWNYDPVVGGFHPSLSHLLASRISRRKCRVALFRLEKSLPRCDRGRSGVGNHISPAGHPRRD